MRSYGPTLIVVCQLLSWCRICCAQPPEPPSPRPSRPSERSAPAEPVEETRSQVIYAKDKNGDLVPIINRPYEEIEKALNQVDGGMGPQRPGYTLDRLVVSGTAGADRAELTVQLTVSASSAAWVRVPLRLGGLLLREPARYEGEGECLFRTDESGREYVAWFRGETTQPHQLSLRALAPVEPLGRQSRLKLNAPRAASYSEMVLTVPAAPVLAEVSPSAVLDSVRQLDGRTELKVLGLTGDFALTWRKADDPAQQPPPVLWADGKISVRVTGSSIRTEAVLSVGSYGSQFTAFRVRLPRGSRMIQDSQAVEPSDYTLRPVADTGDPAETDPQLIDVVLKEKSSSKVEIRLATEQPHQVAQTGEWVELGGFEVLDAVRQSGHVAVQLDGDWHVSFGEVQRIWQVEELPEAMSRGGPVAGFEYSGQPFSLPARISPRAAWTSVDPRYQVLVTPKYLELEARLKYYIGGAKAFAVLVDLAGWDLVAGGVGPSTLVNAEGVVPLTSAPVSIPFKTPTSGPVEISVRARRALAPGATQIDFALPRPLADTVGSGVLIVQPADNVELSPREEELAGLSRQRPEGEPAAGDFKQQSWRYLVDVADARFVSRLQVHSRSITVAIDSRMVLKRVGGHVEQTLSYRIGNEPIEELALEIPASVLNAGRLELSLDGEDLPAPTAGRQDLDEDDTVRVSLSLPESKRKTGPLVLAVRYPLVDRRWPTSKGAVIQLPLVVPGEGECLENELLVVPEPGIKVQPADNNAKWTVEGRDAARGTAEGGLLLSALTPRTEVDVAVRSDGRAARDELVVERAWIHTWFDESIRSDRAVFRFHGGQGPLRLKLPTEARSIKSWLDGQPVELRPEEFEETSDVLKVLWQPPAHDGLPPGLDEHVLEVRYVADRGPRFGRLSIQLPEIQSATARRTYWQLDLPPNEHLLARPDGFTSESTWVWKGVLWGRQPVLGQTDLEAWTGAVPDAAIAQGTNRYLFSTMQIDRELVVRSVSRALLVLAASGSVLLLGLLLIYVPALRHPGLLFVAAIGTLAAGASFPEPVLLWLQAAVVGLVLAVMATLLEARMSRRNRRGARGGSSISHRRSIQSQVRQPVAALPSTATAAVEMEMSAPDSTT